MPEGPELYKAAGFLNQIASQHIFKKVRLLKEPSHKHPLIPWAKPAFSLAAHARGKEIRITCTEVQFPKKETKQKVFRPESLNILLTFGMAGRFAFTKSSETHKHSLLMFDTTDEQTFSFVDTRHFGRWSLTDDWSPSEKRGPCIITEYDKFRGHVRSSLDKPVFDRSICEVMLDQRYFSSIGNYLRAEILYRLDIDPYVSSRSVLENLPEVSCDKNPDILKACHDVCWDVIRLKGSGKPYDPDQIYGDNSVFEDWLQCYLKPGMGNSVDKKDRTMWHSAKFGKGKKIRHYYKPVKSKEDINSVEDVKPNRKRSSPKSKPAARSQNIKTEDSIKLEPKSESTQDPEYHIKSELMEDNDSQLVSSGSVKRRSVRLKRFANQNKENTASNGNTSVKRQKRRKVSTTTSPYFK